MFALGGTDIAQHLGLYDRGQPKLKDPAVLSAAEEKRARKAAKRAKELNR